MRTRYLGYFVLITTLLLVSFGATLITPARGAEISFTVSANYTGGETQEVAVDAAAPAAGYPTAIWTLYYQNTTLVPGTGTTGNLVDATGGHYTATIPVRKFDAGNYYVNVFLADGGSDSGMKNASFTIRHVFRFIGVVGCFYSSETDVVTITSVPFYTSQDIDGDGENDDDLVPQTAITTPQYVIYDALGAPIRTGELTLTEGNWIAINIPVKWMNGNFTVGARFTLTNTTVLETGPANRSLFTRNNASEWYIILVSVIGGAAAAIFITIAFYNKRNASRDLGKKKDKKDKKEIKVLEISKDEIKKAKAGKAPPPKEEVKEEAKGVTKKSGDLIFEVPKWEEGDADK